MAIFKITETELHNMISESVNKALSEGYLNEARTLVDNFDKVAKLMEFNSDDDFYFVQIIKRFKDNKQDDRGQGNYHGGAWYPYKGWRIHSVDELMKLKPQIVDICNKENVRAYITINHRSDKETDAHVIKMKKEWGPRDARYAHAEDIVAGAARWKGDAWNGKRLRFFVDIDPTPEYPANPYP